MIVKKTSLSYEYELLIKNDDDIAATKNPADLSPLYMLKAFDDFFSSTEEYIKAESHPEMPEKESAPIMACIINRKKECDIYIIIFEIKRRKSEK